MERNRDIPEQNEGVDFQDRYASELPSGSESFHQTHGLPKDSWYGERYFECLIAHDLLLQTAAEEQVSAIMSAHANAVRNYPFRLCWDHLREPGPLVKKFAQPAEVPDYRLALFTLIGTITRQGSTDERKTLLASVRKYSYSHPLNSNQDTSEGNQGDENAYSVNETPSQSSTPKAATLEDPDEQGVEIPDPRAIQIVQGQGAGHSNNHGPQDEDERDIQQYTVALKEHGERIGIVPDYDYEAVSLEPPSFRARVIFQQINATADGKNKRLARHRASKEACILLGLPLLSRN